ncbi:MAG: hypothetical protein IJQ81_09195 [Oscillibacter sp.]|nr:hypothetical protein [Oscillibacter sp.]
MSELEPWADAEKPLEDGEEYLERTEKLLYRRLWGYIITQNWPGAGQVVGILVNLKLV